MWESKWGVKDGTQEDKETLGNIITAELMKPSNNGEFLFWRRISFLMSKVWTRTLQKLSANLSMSPTRTGRWIIPTTIKGKR